MDYCMRLDKQASACICARSFFGKYEAAKEGRKRTSTMVAKGVPWQPSKPIRPPPHGGGGEMRTLSPDKRLPLDLKARNNQKEEEEPSKRSPTRVMDLQGGTPPNSPLSTLPRSPEKALAVPATIPSHYENDAVSSLRLVQDQLAPPDIAVTPACHRRPLSRKQQQQQQQQQQKQAGFKSGLPTLDEQTSSEELERLRPFDEPVFMAAFATNSPNRKLKRGSHGANESFAWGGDASSSSASLSFPETRAPSLSSKSPSRKPSSGGSTTTTNNNNNNKPQTRLEQIEAVNAQASDFAKKGEEDRAIALYKKALKYAAAEMHRIQGQLQHATTGHLHPSTHQSIHGRLEQDWRQMGDVICHIRTVMAILYERLGDYQRAIASSVQATAVHQRHLDHSPDDAAAKAGLETMTFMVVKMKSAQSSYDTRRQIHSEIILLRKTIAGMTTNHAAEKALLYGEVEQLAANVMAVEMETLGERHPQVADTCALLSTLALEQNKRPLALARMRQALAIDEVSLGGKHPRTGHDYVRIARIFSDKASAPQEEEEEQAMVYYNKAIHVFGLAGNCAQAIGSCLNDLAVLHMKRREFDLAIEKLSQALDECQYATVKDEHADVSAQAILVWRNQGECYFLQKDFALAGNAYMNALNLQRQSRKNYEALAAGDSADARDLVQPVLASDESIADTLRRLGKAHAAQKRPHEALVAFKEAVVLQQALADAAVKKSKGRQSTDVPARQDELAHTLYCIAEVCTDMEEYEEAINLYSEAMQLRLFSDANKGENRTNLVHCAMSLVGIGNVHVKQKELNDAEKGYNEALGYCRAHGVPDSHAIVAMIKHKLVEVDKERAKVVDEIFQSSDIVKVEEFAERELKRSNLNQAIRAFSLVMTLRKSKLKELKEQRADYTQEKYLTARTLERFGYALTKNGDVDSAMKAYTDALRLFKKNGYNRRADIMEVKLASLKEKKPE